MDLGPLIQLFKDVIIQALGISNLEMGDYLLKAFLASIIIGWLSLFAFMLVKKPNSLKNWRIPDLVNISTVSLIGLIGCVVSYLILINLNFFTILTGGPSSSIKLVHILIFMILYITTALSVINDRKKPTDLESDLVPSELRTFIPKSFMFSFGLLIIAVGQVFLLGAFSKAPYVLTNGSIWRSIVTSGAFMLLGIFVLIITFFPAFMQKYLNKFQNYTIKNNPRKFLIFIAILIALTLVDTITKKDIFGIITGVIILIIIISLVIFFKPIIKAIANLKKKLTPNPTH
jgi:hypothetical protein